MTAANSRSMSQLQSWLLLHQQGDEAAKIALITLASERLRVHISRMMKRDFSRLRRWEQTDDVLQNALIRLHSSLKDIHPESASQFMGLAALQIQRTLIDLSRHHFGPEGNANHHLTDASREIDLHASEEPESLNDWTAFHEAVGTLPEEELETFHLIYYDGLTQSEACELLGINERTIRRRWQSARFLLHQKLKQDME